MSSAPASDDLVEVSNYRSARAADERGLALLASQIPYWIHFREGRYRLYVEPEQSERASAELAVYERDRRRDRDEAEAAVDARPRFPVGPSLLIYPLILTVCFLFQRGPHDWLEEAGLMSARGMFVQGEWWRPLTALTLHADFGHLLGNVGAGLCFAWLACGIYGVGVGWWLILASGFLGNVVTALLCLPADHRSLGASTAVFGALGTLAGHGLCAGFKLFGRRDLLRSTAPLVAGIFLLAFLGGGGPEVDVMAHVGGFAAGAALGWLAEVGRWPERGGRWLGPTLATLTCGGIAAAWAAAIHAAVHG